MDWPADSLSCIFFHQPKTMAPADALPYWTNLFLANPQGYQQTPPGTNGSVAVGMVGPHQFNLTANPGRLDLSLVPSQGGAPMASLGSNPVSPPLIGDAQAALTTIAPYAGKLAAQGNWTRIAVVLNLWKIAADPVAAKTAIDTVLGAEKFPAGVSDLNFGFNKTMTLLTRSTMANRVCRWSTGTQHYLLMQMGVGIPFQSPGMTNVVHGAFFNLDVNTSQQTVPYLSAEAVTTLDELIAETKRLIAGGYSELVASL